MSNQILEEGLLKLGLGGDGRKLSLLTRYIEEIELFNPAYGLVKVESRQDLIVKHILDSLAPVKILGGLLAGATSGRTALASAGSAPVDFSPAAFAPAIPGGPLRVADIGSGAGLPGIPLAICMGGEGSAAPGTSPVLEFSLVERMGRRAGFLQNTLALLALPHVKVEEADLDELAGKPEWAGHFDLIVFRAFKPLEMSLLKSFLKLLAPGGYIAAYKGRLETVEKEMDALTASWSKNYMPPENLVWEIVPLDVPFLEEERHLLVIETL